MTRNVPSLQGRFRWAGIAILVAGLLAAVLVYIAASRSGPDAIGYRIVDDQAYAIAADDSAREMQQLERIGGKASVLTFQFQRWLDSLWHGQRLAYTLAVISIGLGLLCLHIASLMGETGAA